LKVFDKKLFEETPQEKRREALNKWFKDHARNPLRLAESIKELGGLHIIGSERHEARRIDNQLRGRSGRQGDPGSSRFFLSLDDDLMRIFAKDWVRNFLRASGMKDGQPLESRMVSRSIEKAQRRVEEHHFGTRKRLLEYDEVMNEQRKLVYSLRQKVLEARELKETMREWVEDVIALAVDKECGGENPPPADALQSLCNWAKRKFLLELTPQDLANKTIDEVEDFIEKKVFESYEAKDNSLGEIDLPKDVGTFSVPLADIDFKPEDSIESVMKRVAEKITPPPGSELEARIEDGAMKGVIKVKVRERKMRLLERFLLLDIIDTKWKNHLRDMDTLREGIYLRSYAQKDPKLEYKREGFDLFEEMFNSMKEQASDMVLKMQVSEEVEKQEVASVWGDV
jgi:preprotein translocase subunit SecA